MTRETVRIGVTEVSGGLQEVNPTITRVSRSTHHVVLPVSTTEKGEVTRTNRVTGEELTRGGREHG